MKDSQRDKPGRDNHPPDDRRLIVVLSLLGILAVAQAGAMGRQLLAGYRPFGQAPVRVPLSWDMFATHVERCEITWYVGAPQTGGTKIQRLSETSRPFEWFAVRATREGYRELARERCTRGVPVERIKLACWLPDGSRPSEEMSCP